MSLKNDKAQLNQLTCPNLKLTLLGSSIKRYFTKAMGTVGITVLVYTSGWQYMPNGGTSIDASESTTGFETLDESILNLIECGDFIYNEDDDIWYLVTFRDNTKTGTNVAFKIVPMSTATGAFSYGADGSVQ